MNKQENEELVSMANKNGVPAIIAKRGEKVPHFFPCFSAVILTNTKGNIILHKNAFTKTFDPGCWSYSAAGAVGAGETYEQAAERELLEELNVKAKIHASIGLIPVIREGELKAFHHVFWVISDDPITPDSFEIAEIGEFTSSKLNKMIVETPDQFSKTFVRAFVLWKELSSKKQKNLMVQRVYDWKKNEKND